MPALRFGVLPAALLIVVACGGDSSPPPSGGGGGSGTDAALAGRPGSGGSAGSGNVAGGGAPAVDSGVIGPGPDASGGSRDAAVDVGGNGGSTGSPDAPVEGSRDASSCGLDGDYSYGADGGFVLSQDRSELTHDGVYKRSRLFPRSAQPPVSCMVTLPACGGPSVNVGEIAAAIAHPDVQAALAAARAPIFGYDARPVDGVAWSFGRGSFNGSGPGGLIVGGDCGSRNNCQNPPAGVTALKALLDRVDAQALGDPSCAALRQR